MAYWWWFNHHPDQSLIRFLMQSQILLRTSETLLTNLVDDGTFLPGTPLLTVHGLEILREEIAAVRVPPLPTQDESRETQPVIAMTATVPMLRMEPLPLPMQGTQLGDCLITERVDSLGIATFRALHRAFNLPVVLQFLPFEYHHFPIDVRRQFRETIAQIIRLEHPHLVRIWDFVDQGPLIYLVVEYVEGITLAELIRQSGRMVADRCIRSMIQIADALTTVHENGLIHGQIHPETIMITRDGHARLGQTGMCGLREHLPASDNIAARRAPDRNGPWTTVDDLYSLGLTLYEALTGQPHEPNRPIAISTQRTPIVLDLTALLQRLLTPRIEDRFPSAIALRQRLMEIEIRLKNRPDSHSGLRLNAPMEFPSSQRGSHAEIHSESAAGDSSVMLGREARSATPASPSHPQQTPTSSPNRWKQLAQRFGSNAQPTDNS